MAALRVGRAVRILGSMVKSFAAPKPVPVRCFSGQYEVQEIDLSAQKGQVVSSTTIIDGKKVHYVKTGHGNRLVFLLPGMLGTGKTDFANQINGLNKDLFTIIAWDPPGYGRSRPPDREWPEDWFSRDADMAATLMKTISGRKYSLVGFSDGGITACILAARYPEQVDRLISWGAAAYVTDEDVKINESLSDVSKWSNRMRESYLSVYDEEYLSRICLEWCAAYNKYAGDSEGICKKDLPEIECPALIIHGQKDVFVGQHHADYIHENIKDSRLINVPDGKHNLHMKYHKMFNSVVEQFIINPNLVQSKI